MYFFEYGVKFFDEMIDEEAEEYGITFGKNYKEAAANLEEYYGKTLMIITFLSMTDQEKVYNGIDIIPSFKEKFIKQLEEY